MRAAIDARVDGTWPNLREDFDATLLTPQQADRLVGPLRSEGQPTEKLTRDLIVLLKEFGKVKLGRPVDFAWCWSAAQIAARSLMGVCDFDLGNETNAAAIQTVFDHFANLFKKQKEVVAHNDDVPF